MLNKQQQDSLLVVGTPATRKAYSDAVRLGESVDRRLESLSGSYCHGTHQFGRPMMALASKRNLGSVRHVLSQMVVAGTMVHQPPVEIVRSTSESEQSA